MEKTETSGVFLPLTPKEMSRIARAAQNASTTAECWLLLTILGVLEVEEEDAEWRKAQADEEAAAKIENRNGGVLKK
jgi:hypothetical protein